MQTTNHASRNAPIGTSVAMERLRAVIDSVSGRACTVIIRGESGSGKECVARHIHGCSPRWDKPFVAVDCTTLKDTLFESQLFGHRKGAFTGADYATLGFIRSADGGTLFLDEIGELALPVQARLLRCIQDRAVVPLGETVPIPVDVRILAATHRDLRAMVKRGEFREDLFYRLNVVQMVVPPLRERRSDVGVLARHFLAYFAELYAEPVKSLSEQTLAALEQHTWPGNVRELANTMEQMHIMAGQPEISSSDLPEEMRPAAEAAGALSSSLMEIPTLECAEQRLIARALSATRGNQTRAAEVLHIDRRRLRRKIRLYGLQAMLRGGL